MAGCINQSPNSPALRLLLGDNNKIFENCSKTEELQFIKTHFKDMMLKPRNDPILG